jgi:DNA-binding NarL/FixJ family response regulator
VTTTSGTGAAPQAGAPVRHRLAILDGHALVVDGLSEWIQINAQDFNVVAATASWPDLLVSLDLRPEVVLMVRAIEPVPLPFRVAKCLEAGAKVVVMSAIDEPELRAEALAAGASAFVSKMRPAAELLDAARWSLNPSSQCPPEDGAQDLPEGTMSDEDLAVIRLYASGHSTLDISLVQGIKFEAVRSSLKRIRQMYEAQNRVVATRDDLLRRAAEDGYLA